MEAAMPKKRRRQDDQKALTKVRIITDLIDTAVRLIALIWR
jgi:hypothetical protein